jgi:hypothetical protein
LFLSGLMGLLMFFIIHRILVFFFLLFVTATNAEFQYYNFLLWDYITLCPSLVLGVMYGLWVGRYWYRVVYHENSHNGFVDFLNKKLWGEEPKQIKVFQHKMEAVAEKLENDLSDLEALAKDFPVIIKPKRVIKRTVVKKSPARKAPAKTRKKKS